MVLNNINTTFINQIKLYEWTVIAEGYLYFLLWFSDANIHKAEGNYNTNRGHPTNICTYI